MHLRTSPLSEIVNMKVKLSRVSKMVKGNSYTPMETYTKDLTKMGRGQALVSVNLVRQVPSTEVSGETINHKGTEFCLHCLTR